MQVHIALFSCKVVMFHERSRIRFKSFALQPNLVTSHTRQLESKCQVTVMGDVVLVFQDASALGGGDMGLNPIVAPRIDREQLLSFVVGWGYRI